VRHQGFDKGRRKNVRPEQAKGTKETSMMKWSPLYLAALTPFAFLSSGVLLGPVVVLMVTLAIFFGTLSLGRTPASAPVAQQDRSLAP
jgi:hypothetical protein